MKNIAIAFLLLITALIICLGCYGPRKAGSQMDKAHERYEELAAKKCGAWHPTKVGSRVEIRTERDTLKIPGPTVFTNCDSIVKAAKNNPAINTQAVGAKCPDVTYLRERIYKDSIATEENTAKVRGLELEIERHKDDLSKKDAEIAQKEKEKTAAIEDKKDWRKYALITWGILALIFLIKLAIKFFGGYFKGLIKT